MHKLAIVGYGRWAHDRDAAPEYGFPSCRIDVNDDISLARGRIGDRVSRPEAAVGNVEKLAALGRSVVVGLRMAFGDGPCARFD